MDVDVAVALPLLGWLASGLAAFSLTPGNRAAQALLAAGTLLSGSWLLEGAALAVAGDSADGAVLRVITDAAFLGGLAAVVWLLATYPDGVFDASWHRYLVRLLAVLAAAGPLGQALGAPTLRVGLEPSTAAPNPLAVDGLGALGAVGDAVVRSEPTWLLLGVLVLTLRWFGAPHGLRRDLLRPLASLALLAALLVLVAVSAATGIEPASIAFRWLFLAALGLFPVVLLVGISRRARGTERELAASRARLVAAEDEVRRRIERDLHDGVQQQLVALLSLTELAARQLRREPVEAEQTLVDVREQVRASIRELRELVHGIRPPVLEDAGVAAALDSRLAQLPAEVHLDADRVRGRRWPAGMESAAYFVVCEAVTNALKHAPGSPVQVLLAGDGRELAVEVRDHGPGIPPGAVHAGRGLAGLRDRVTSWGGSFDVSAEGGTVVRATFPVEAVPR